MAPYELITEGIIEDISNAIRVKRGTTDSISVEDMAREIRLIDGEIEGTITPSENKKLVLISSSILTDICDAVRSQEDSNSDIYAYMLAQAILNIGGPVKLPFDLFSQDNLHVENKDQANGGYRDAWFKEDEDGGYTGTKGANITTSWDTPIPAGYKYLILDVESGGKEGAYNMSTVYLTTKPGLTGYYGGQFEGQVIKAVSLVNFNSSPESINSQAGVVIDSDDECYLDRQKVIIDISDIDEDFYVSWHRCDNWTTIYSIEAVDELPDEETPHGGEADMRTHNFEMVRGDTLTFDLKMNTIDTSTVTRLIMTVKKKAKDEEPIFTKDLDDGIRAVDEHTFRVRLAPEDTESLRAGTYVYDIEMTFDTEVYTPLMGNITLIQDVTTRG